MAILIRKYQPSDAPALWKLFYHTIRFVNIRDYSLVEVEAWAPDNFNFEIWQKKMLSIDPFVAEINDEVVGYCDLQIDGKIDHFFCHHEHQGEGVGRALMNHVFEMAKQQGRTRFYSEVSITARPFFEHFGFKTIKEQKVEIRGQMLTNFVMEKYN
ncbi:GNAT family N-acetyltransferase [Vibrio mexicanus]|uniref:GNAT family N-acetyltransferase n=1 Tax=Vibrio mexicanus TaxID=1004326 RepID=UPI00063C0677|nr:GNAT family N-acetyltransferase [Vibrio mexicanus]